MRRAATLATTAIHQAARHPRLTLAVAMAYFVASALGHDQVQKIFRFAQARLAPDVYNQSISGAGLAGLALLSWGLARRLRGDAAWRIKLAAAGGTLLLVAGAFSSLMAINSESVHFPQYALLAMLLFPLVRRLGETVLWITLLGAVDEGYQYWVLHGDWGVYLDFNDILLNLIGGGLGVALLCALPELRPEPAAGSQYGPGAWLRSPPALVVGALLLLATAGLLLGILGVYPGSGASILLSRSLAPDSFWVNPDWGSKPFHIMHPATACALALLLCSAYAHLDSRLALQLRR